MGDDLYDRYKIVNVFRLDNVACLLMGMEVVSRGTNSNFQIENERKKAMLLQLITDAKSGVLPFDRRLLDELSKPKGWDTTGNAGLFLWEYAEVSRNDLMSWCESKGIKPAFLFQPEPTGTTPPETHEPQSRKGDTSSYPGRPSVMNAIKVEMERRAKADPKELLPSIGEEAKYLADWAKTNFEGVQTAGEKAIGNALGKFHRTLKSAKTEHPK